MSYVIYDVFIVAYVYFDYHLSRIKITKKQSVFTKTKHNPKGGIMYKFQHQWSHTCRIISTVLSILMFYQATLPLAYALDRVEDFSVRAKRNKIQLSWTPSANTEKYEILRSLELSSGFEKIAETSSAFSTFVDETVDNGTLFYYQVKQIPDAKGRPCFTLVLAALPPASRLRLGYVPDVTFKDVSEAENLLSLSSFSSGLITHEPNRTVPLGQVIRQDPPANSHVPRGFVVNLVLSSGRPGNASPAVTITSPANNTSFPETAAIDLAGIVTDVEDGDLSSSITWTSSRDGNLGTGSSVSMMLSPGTHKITARVSDSAGLSGEASMTITVTETNDAPVITSTPNTLAAEGIAFTYDVEALDSDTDDLLSYSVITSTPGMSIDPVSGLISWTPNDFEIGHNDVTVRVMDPGGLFDTQIFTITVAAMNRPPTITSPPVTSAVEGESYSYNVEVWDKTMADSLSYSLPIAPLGMSIDPLTGFISWTPSYFQAGEHQVLVQVDDEGGLMDKQNFTVTVTNVNRPPVISSNPRTITTENTVYTYRVEGYDPDTNDELTFSLVAAPTGMIMDGLVGDITWTPSELQSGDHTVRVRVEDTGGLFSEQPFTLTVSPPSDLIIANVEISDMTGDWQALEMTASFSVDIHNQGAGPALGEFIITVFDDANDNGIFDMAVDGILGTTIRSGLDQEETVTVSGPASGPVSFRGNLVYAFVDSGGAIPETDEGNNVSRSEVACRTSPTGLFNPVIEWSWTSSRVLRRAMNVMNTPAVVDLTDDGIPEVIFNSTSSHKGNLVEPGVLRVLRGDSGNEVFTITNSAYGVNAASSLAVGDIDEDGRPEIIACDSSGKRLIAFEHNGQFKWRSANLESINWGAPSLADLDGDASPEIIIGRQVLNSDGTIRWTGSGGRGSQANVGPLSLVADLNMDGSPEVIAGNTAYTANGSILWETPLADGYNAVGNFDADPFPEIVLVVGGQVYLIEHNGAIKWGPVAIPGGGAGGPPAVADYDGDSEVEIGVAGRSRYTVFETDGRQKWATVIRDKSSRTGSSVFDFDGDGSAEVVYRDELRLRVYRGTDGTVLYETPMSSCTWLEYVLVADVDADGNAEMVAVANNNCSFGPERGVFVFGDASDSWVSTRPLWNQHSYHITNINDDGTIPALEANNWERYNNYRQNVKPSGSVLDAPDLTASFVLIEEESETTFIHARIGNGGALMVGSKVPVSFYDGDPNLDGLLLGTTQTTRKLEPGHYEDVAITLAGGISSAHPIWVVADDAGNLIGLTNECDEENNFHNSDLLIIGVNHPPNITSSPITMATENRFYTYNMEAVDPDAGDEIIFALTTSPVGMTIDQTLGLISWTPSANHIGANEVSVRAEDREGLVDVQEFTVTVDAANTPPVAGDDNFFVDEGRILITTDVDGTGTPGTSDDNGVLANDEDGQGDLLTAELVTGPSHASNFMLNTNGLFTYEHNGSETTTDSFSYTVSDGVNPPIFATVTVTIIPANDIPMVVVESPANTTTLLEGDTIDFFGLATDAEDGDITSLLTWTSSLDGVLGNGRIINPTLTVGNHTVTAAVTDGQGAEGSASITVTVNVNISPVVTIDQPVNRADFTASDRIHFAGSARDPEDGVVTDSLAWSSDLDGTLGNGDSFSKHLSLGIHTITASAKDSLGFPGHRSISIVVNPDPPDVMRPEVVIVAEPLTTGVGNVVYITVNADDNVGVVSQELLVDGIPLALDANGKATLSSAVPAIFIAEAFAIDAAGNEGYDRKEIRFLIADDTTPPTVSFSAPAENAILTEPTDIIASASDANLIQYQLAYSLKDKNDFIRFASGDGSVNNDVLGHLDTSLLRNGLYDVRLTAEDASGNTVSVTRTFRVDGDLKVGNFTISFNDLTIPVAGIPISITRIYDSRLKTKGDFGIGWKLSISDIDVFESGNFREGWQQVSSGGLLPIFAVQPTEPHFVMITFPDGRSHEFNMVVNPTSQALFPLQFTSASFTPVVGTFSSLVSLDNNDLIVSGGTGTVDLLEDTLLDRYDPDRYQLTDVNGTVYTFHQQSGLQSIIEPNGNAITFTADGISHSSGKSVTFTRDSQDRITRITDPKGQTVDYSYDAYGDLIRVTDQETNSTQFIYNSTHGLLDIIDPRGITAVRNEYDDEGRLTATVDAQGHRLEFTHDMDGRKEVIRDRMGNVTVFVYDQNGNVLSQTDALGHTTTFTYDTRGNETSKTDPLGHTTTFTYDDRDNLLSTTDPLGNTTLFTYDTRNQILTTTDPLGNETTNSYDAKGNLIATTNAKGERSENTYDSAGNLIATRDSRGNATATFAYDIFGNLTEATDAFGFTRSFAYDENGNQLTTSYEWINPDDATDIRTVTTQTIYDATGQVIRTTDPENNESPHSL